MTDIFLDPSPLVESMAAGDLSPSLRREGMKLSALVWPPKVPEKKPVEEQKSEEQQDSDTMSQMTWHFVREGDSIIAMARTFRRVMGDESGCRFPILALAGVCTHPQQRGRGLGRAVVLAAWLRLGSDMPVSFFQTGIPSFYEQLGARLVRNRIYDSTDAPRLFWDPYARIYPTDAQWPQTAIDLRGGGW